MTVIAPSSVSVSSSEVGSSASVWDGTADSTSRWRATTNAASVTFDMGTATAIDYYTIVPSMNTANEDPSAWTFESSPDNSTWTTLDTKSSQTFATNSARTFAVTGNDRYYKFNVSALAGGGSFHCSISEMQVGRASPQTAIIETQSGTATGTTTITATLSGTPTASQVVIASITADKTATVTGLGATWTKIRDGMAASASTYTHVVYVGTGASSGTVTATAGSNFTGRMEVFIVDNLINPLVYHQAAYNSTRTANNGQFVIGAIYESGGTNVAISGSSTPSSGAYTVGTRYDPTGSIRINQAWKVASTETAHNVIWTNLSFAAGDMTVIGMPNPVGVASVEPPKASLVLDANNPAVYIAAPKASLVIDANAPLVSPPNVQPPKAAIALNAPDPTVFVAVPKASLVLDANAPAVSPLSMGFGSIVIDAKAPLVIGPIKVTSMHISGAGSADITDLFTVVATSMQMHGAGRANMRIPLDWDADPRTGRPQWKFLVASAPHLGGELLCQLELRSEPIEEDLEAVTSGTFAVRTLDPKRSLIQPVTTWLHVYRGRHHMGGGPILRGQQSEDGTITTYPWRDPRWYLSGVMRPIHQIPRRDLLLNGDFTQGLNYWTGGYDAGTIPALAPITTVVDSDFKRGGKSMQITGADKTQLITSEVATASVFVPNSSSYLPGGEAHIQAVGTAIPDGSTVQIIGHTANDGTGSGLTLSLNRALAAKATLLTQDPTLTFQLPSSLWPHDVTSGNVVGRGYYQPLASNSTPAGMAQNRRVTISYQGVQTALGSAQWRKQTVRVTAETQRKVRLSPVGMFKITDWIGANLAGLAARVEVRKVGAPSTDDPTSKADVEMTEETPRDRWMSTTQLEGNLEVEIPAGSAQYDVTLFLYAPAGTIEWTDVHLYPDDGLYFYGIDQATIAQTLVEHAQDPTKGWADLGIGTRTPLTGVVRDKEYPYYAMRPTDVALAELTQLYRGLDMSIEVTPTTATFVTHFPRRGTTSDLVLRYGGNVIRWEPASTNDVASLVIAQADGTGIGRPEQYAIDDVSLGGMRLATIVNAENETPLNELDELAVLTLARAKRPVPAYWVTVPASHASEVLSRLQMGDSCRLVLPDLDGGVRLVKRITDPNTDTLRQLMALED